MAVPLFFKYICDVAKPLVSGYDDHGISHLDHILTTGNADAAVAVQASHQKILAEIQLCKRDISYGRFLTDRKFQCFCIAIQNMIKSFYIAADAVLSGADILQDIISSDIFRVDDTSDIQESMTSSNSRRLTLATSLASEMLLAKRARNTFSSSRFVSVTKIRTRKVLLREEENGSFRHH